MTVLIRKLKLQHSLSTSAWPNYGLDVLNITMHTEVVIHSMNADVWCWSKICGSLLLQWEVINVKFLINSNITLTVLNLHQKTDPMVQQDFKGQGHYDKVKGQTRGMLLLTKAKRPLKFKMLCGFNKHAVKLRMHEAAPYAFPIPLNTF